MADEIQWITVNGKHIPIGAGETKAQAIKKAFGDNKSVAEHNEDTKERQIKQAQAERERLNSTDTNSPFHEVVSKKFNKYIADAKASRGIQDRWRVDVHTADEYEEKGCRNYISKGGSTVSVTKDGDIISVCKRNGDKSIRGSQLMAQAVKMGGTKLDSFAGNHDFYVSQGFEPISWTPFSVEYAPNGWSKSGADKEPVIFYKYVGKGNVKNIDKQKFLSNTKPFVGADGYDDAYAYRDSQITQKKKGDTK